MCNVTGTVSWCMWSSAVVYGMGRAQEMNAESSWMRELSCIVIQQEHGTVWPPGKQGEWWQMTDSVNSSL